MAIDWKAFYARGGFSNENSDPASYDDGHDRDEEDNGWKDDEQYEHDYDYSDM